MSRSTAPASRAHIVKRLIAADIVGPNVATLTYCREHPREARQYVQAARRAIDQLVQTAEQLLEDRPASRNRVPARRTSSTRRSRRPARRATRSSAASGDSPGDDDDPPGDDDDPPPPGRLTAPIPRLGLSRDEAAAALGMSLDSFERHVQPTLPICRLGRMRIVPVGALERWLTENAAKVIA